VFVTFLHFCIFAVYVAKTPQCIRFTSSSRLEMCLFRVVLRRKFARNSHVSLRKCMSFTFRTCLIMCAFCVVLSRKNIIETSLRNVLNVSVFAFNTSCNVTLSRCFTSQILPKYVRFALQVLPKYIRSMVQICLKFARFTLQNLSFMYAHVCRC